MGPRGQYRSARHVSGRPQRRREDGRAPAWRDRQCRLRCRHDVRSDPCLYRRESRRHSDHADAGRRMGPQWRARQCGLAGLYPHRHAGSRYRLGRAEQEMAGKSDRDEPAGRADRGRARHRVAAFADEQRRHRNQSARRRRIYRRHHLGRLWRPARKHRARNRGHEHEYRTAAQETRSVIGHRRGRYPRAADGAGAHDRRRALAGAALQAQARRPPDPGSASRRAAGNPGRNPRRRAEAVRKRRTEARHHRPRRRTDAEDDARHARRKRRAGICAVDARGNGLHSARGTLDQTALRAKSWRSSMC